MRRRAELPLRRIKTVVQEQPASGDGSQDEQQTEHSVKSCKDSDRPSGGDGGTRSRTPSVDKLNRLIGPSPAPRMLTPYEIELLRKCAEETAEVVREVLAEKKDGAQSGVATEAHQDRCSRATRQRGRKPG